MDTTNPAEPLSPRWEEKFALLEKVTGGGATVDAFQFAAVGNPQNGGAKLTVKEVFTVICWPAFFFGFLWYFYKGMWKKALVLIAISLAIGILIQMISPKAAFIGIFYSLIIGKLATADYYRNVKQGFNDWW